MKPILNIKQINHLLASIYSNAIEIINDSDVNVEGCILYSWKKRNIIGAKRKINKISITKYFEKKNRLQFWNVN